MIVKFDSLDRYELPKMSLCNPGAEYKNGLLSKCVGILSNTSDEEVVFNFNAVSELNFRINKVTEEDEEDTAHLLQMYKAVQNRRLIFLEGIGFFVITQIEDGYDGGEYYKDVKAESIEAEFSQKAVPYIADGTYRFSTDLATGVVGLIDIVCENFPMWTIGEIDESVAERYRTFEDIDVSRNCLSFMIENMQEAYECIFSYDIVDRVINVYDQANYVRRTDIHITKDDLVNSIEIQEDADDLYTALQVLGSEDVMISAVHPMGTNVIYNFTHYLDWMSDDLAEAVRRWQDAVDYAKDAYYRDNLAYYNLLATESNLMSEQSRLSIQATMYQRCKDNIVAEQSTDLVGSYNTVIVSNGGSPITIEQDIADTIQNIDDLIAACTSSAANVSSQLNTIAEQKSTLLVGIEGTINRLRLSSDWYIDEIGEEHQNFTEEQLAELTNYIFEGSYTDEYVIFTDQMTYNQKFEQMKILYDRAVSQLEKISVPTQEFDIDTENFVFIKEFEAWSNQLETGCLINVELDDDDIAMLFLSSMTINYEDHKFTMKFGNRFNKFDPRTLFEGALGKISKSANTLSYIKDLVYPAIKSGDFNAMQEAISTSRDLTMASAMATDNEEVVIDSSGITSRRMRDDGSYDPRQIKLNGKDLLFTDDAWETSKVAIGEIILGDGTSTYGVNAETIIGDIIIGNEIHIVDDDGNDMFSALDSKIETSINDLEDSLSSSITQTAQDLTIQFNTRLNETDGVVTQNGYVFDSSGLHISETNNPISNTLDNTGMYVRYQEAGAASATDVLVANAEGVNAINLTANNFLTIGLNSRFEDYTDGSNNTRTGCFYVGDKVKEVDPDEGGD